MSEAKNHILGMITNSLGVDGDDTIRKQAVVDRIVGRRRGTVPERATGNATVLIDRFVEYAEGVATSIDRLDSDGDIPAAVAAYLARENLPAAFRMAPHPDLQAIDWDANPALSVTEGASDGNDEVGLGRAVCGVAETGTLVLTSGPESPTTLNFLPETEIVMVRESEIVGGYEDAFDLVRARSGPDGMLPRTVNMITGPSRTGDIEQTIYLGAHGPRRLYILLIGDG